MKRPTILILDEATSAIDVRGEKIVQAALDSVSKGRTTIMIAHRLSTIVKADNIVVLKKGQVVQQGSHEELSADHEGAYWSLANAQKLTLGMELSAFSSASDAEKSVAKDEEVLEEIPMDIEEFRQLDVSLPRSGSSLGSFGLFLWEQRTQWRGYSFMIMGAWGAGSQ